MRPGDIWSIFGRDVYGQENGRLCATGHDEKGETPRGGVVEGLWRAESVRTLFERVY